MELRDALQNAKERLAEAEAKLQDLTGQIGRYREEVRGLELALSYHEGTAQPISAKNGWIHLGRAAAVERLLRELETPMSPRDIAHELGQRGRTDDTGDLVSAALAYLKSKGAVHQVDRGSWMRRNRIALTEGEEQGP